ncbi:hypothetical protein P7C71_g6328, partial [Lecanoromycetidae sp. Uapishka_2]
MDEEPTQQATQPFHDPRRQGNDSILSYQDQSDIICILFPTSRPAHDAIQLTAEAAPQHIKQNHDVADAGEDDNDLSLEDSNTHADRSQGSDVENEQLPDQRKGKDGARDIALRFSSKVHNLCLGFVFGRNPKSCDMLLCDYDNKQVSNKHFRIYMNNHGVLMLEDTSTNGTIVDNTLLQGDKAKASDRDSQPRRTLVDGSMICLPTITRTNGDSVRFLVKMPGREGYLKKYQQNLATYLACIEQAERRAAATADSATKGLPMVLPQTVKTMQQGLQQDTTPNGSILAAATGQHHHGMHWNGGDKYNVIGYIGKGAFAMVYKLSSKRDGEVFAVKEIDKGKIKDKADAHKAQKELNVIKNLRHPNIVKYIDHLDTPSHLYIIMEFVAYGDLRAWTDAGNAMPESYKTQRYENSVDTWSFAAVLYHLLCGRAPFPGTQENLMLLNVMNTPIDWERLKQAGITFDGIDFIQKMLVIEPSQRASDEVLLEHPWLLSASDRPDLEKSQPKELDASQLSITDNDQYDVDELQYIDDLADPREPKRVRAWPQQDASPNAGEEMSDTPEFDMTGMAPGLSHHSPPQRLFGEIGTSALRSSGVLGETAHAALEVAGGASYDASEFQGHGHGGGSYDPATFGVGAGIGVFGGGSHKASSTSASYVDPGFGQASRAEDVSYIDPNYVSTHPTNEAFPVTQQNIQYPQLPAGAGYTHEAPSLLGAEALVRQLNMASPESGVSGSSENSKPASPKTPHSRELSPTVPGSKRASQGHRSADDEVNAKRSKTHRTSSSPPTRHQSDNTFAQSHSDTSQAGNQGHGRSATAGKGATQPDQANRTIESSDSDDHQDGQQPRERTKSHTTMPSTAFNSQDSANDSNGCDKPSSKPASRRESTSSNTATQAPPTHSSQPN